MENFSDERSKKTAEIMQRFNDVFQRHDPSGLQDLVAEDCVIENTVPAPDGERHVGREACVRLWSGIATAPGTGFDLEETFAAGDRATIRWRYRWGEGQLSARRQPDARARRQDRRGDGLCERIAGALAFGAKSRFYQGIRTAAFSLANFFMRHGTIGTASRLSLVKAFQWSNPMESQDKRRPRKFYASEGAFLCGAMGVPASGRPYMTALISGSIS